MDLLIQYIILGIIFAALLGLILWKKINRKHRKTGGSSCCSCNAYDCCFKKNEENREHDAKK